MIKEKFRSNLSEIAIYVIVWLFILSGPVFVSSGHTVELSDHFLIDWIRMLHIFILFILNSLWLVPRYLFRKKTRLYIISVLSLSILFICINELAFNYIRHRSFSIENIVRINGRPNGPSFDRGRPLDARPEEASKFSPSMPYYEQTHPDQYKRMPPDSQMPQSLNHILPSPEGKAISPDFRKAPHFERHGPPRLFLGIVFFNQILLCLLILSLNTAIKVTIKWFKDEQARREMEKEYLRTELTFLQNQISPHFFMNTLNNIHALIDINGRDAQLAIVRLSKMMRHLLYESDQEKTTLKKEIEFLESYIDLMKLRVDETIRISFLVPQNYRNVKFPPLLLIPFIENAFKHGISYQKESFINTIIELNDNIITFGCTNSLFPRKTMPDTNSGIGLKNVRKRLDLLFGNRYTLVIDENKDEFRIKLTIPVYED